MTLKVELDGDVADLDVTDATDLANVGALVTALNDKLGVSSVSGRVRAEIARSVNRRKTPELVFEVTAQEDPS